MESSGGALTSSSSIITTVFSLLLFDTVDELTTAFPLITIRPFTVASPLAIPKLLTNALFPIMFADNESS